jgi:hypothetical protein
MNAQNDSMCPISLYRFFAIPIFLVSGILGISEVAAAQTTTPTLPVTLIGHGKALSEILDQIQIAYKTPIDFEEAPLQNHDDTQIVNVAGLQAKRVSRASDLSVVITSLDSSPYLAVQSAIAAYIQAGYPGVYGIYQRDNRLDVLPISVKNANGTVVNINPIMETPITFPWARRTVADTVETIANLASEKSGYRILLISTPALAMQTVELGADSQSVGDVIQKFATLLNDTFSIRLHYSVDEGVYSMDFRRTTAPDTAGKPWVPTPPNHPSKVGPSSSPFFKKNK